MDLGAGRRGVDMGPSAIRVTRLTDRLRELGVDVEDRGDIPVPIPESIAPGDTKTKFGDAILKVCDRVRRSVHDARGQGRVPVVLGGDHSLAIGSIAGVAEHEAGKGGRIGLIWIDAHGDMNTPWSTPSGNVHGMPLSHVLGMWSLDKSRRDPCVRPENTCLVGVRDLDEREKGLIRESGVHVFTMKEIDRAGISSVMEQAIRVALAGTSGIHVSFDIDAVDPSIAPGVGTPKRGGLNYREAHLSMELIADTGKLLALDMVEVNPILDSRNATAELATELILSGLGKRIL